MSDGAGDVLDFAKPALRLEWSPEWSSRTLRLCWSQGAEERWIMFEVEDADLDLSHREFMRWVVGRAMAILADL